MPGGGSRQKDAIVKDEDIVFREEVEWKQGRREGKGELEEVGVFRGEA